MTGSKLPVWDIVDAAFRFTRRNIFILAASLWPLFAAMELLDYVISLVERAIGLSDPNAPVPWAIWLPLHFLYLATITFLLAIVSIPIVELTSGMRVPGRALFRLDGRTRRLWFALFGAWVATFIITALFQIAADYLLLGALASNFDVTMAVIESRWYGPSFWAMHFSLMVIVLAWFAFFAPAVATLETGNVVRRAFALCRGRFFRVFLIALAVEAPFVLAFLLMPLPFHGVLGFGAESVFAGGIMVTAPSVSPLIALLKHGLDGGLSLIETSTFTAAAAMAYRYLRPELEFD
jgi:hypothetical protein